MFITLEGPEGSGKSTQAAALAHSLRARGTAVTRTREPGGTALGERVRALLLDPGGEAAVARTELLLFAAARAQLVERVIRPALARGESVVCDRYADSTRAYQGAGLGVPASDVDAAIALATGGLEPDVTLLLDVDAATGLRRRRAAGEADGWNEIDARALTFHERVRAEYLRLAELYPHRIVIVDASLAPEEVEAALIGAVLSRLQAPTR